jgi:hypothetical protein
MEQLAVTLPSSIPLLHEAEVIVMGGGPGGIGAAVAAARAGADVLLVEHYGFLGGMATAGEVNPFMPNHFEGESLDQGIFEEWLARCATYGGQRGSSRVFDPCAARLAAEDLCLEAGVRLLLHHRIAHVECADRRIRGLVLHSKSGLVGARANHYIDSTGDGDLAALAGCSMAVGNDEGSPFVQPMTLCFKLAIDRADLPEGETDPYQAMQKVMPQIQAIYSRARESGRTCNPRENVLTFRGVDDDVVHFNSTRVVKHSAIDGAALSRAEVLARKQLRELVDLLRSEVPIFRHAHIHSIATQIGIRESRRLQGRATVVLDDYKNGRTWSDGIARVTYPVDIHNPLGTGTLFVDCPKGSWYEIPYRALLPKELDNLAVACRAISVDHAVHSSVRVMPPVCSIGQAAGCAAAMAQRLGLELAAVDGVAVKRQLIADGRNLIENPPEFTARLSEEEKAALLRISGATRASFSA